MSRLTSIVFVCLVFAAVIGGANKLIWSDAATTQSQYVWHVYAAKKPLAP